MGGGQQTGLPSSGVSPCFGFLHMDEAISPCSLAFHFPYGAMWCISGYPPTPDLVLSKCMDEKMGWQLLRTQIDLDLLLRCFLGVNSCMTFPIISTRK